MTQSSKREKAAGTGIRAMAMDSHPSSKLMRALNVLNTETNARNPFLQPSGETPQANQQHKQEGTATEKSKDSSPK